MRAWRALLSAAVRGERPAPTASPHFSAKLGLSNFTKLLLRKKRARHMACSGARMAKENRDQEEQSHVPTEKKLEQLYELLDGIETCMLTTRTSDVALVSRPMQTQARRPGTDLWFMTSIDSGKIDELIAEPQVNLGFYRDGTREYVSVSG